MRRLIALSALAASLAAVPALTAAAATTAAPSPGSEVSVSVSQGSLHFNRSRFTAKPGLVRIDFTNNSTAAHNVSLEHDGEFEYGASLTIKKSSVAMFLYLTKGTYHLYSSVGTDEDKGMSGTLIVS